MKEAILNFIKLYDKKLYYTLRLQLQSCTCNLYLNGIPVANFYVKGGFTSEIPLNNAIRSSGSQQLKIELRPLNEAQTLSSHVDCSAEIGRRAALTGRQLGDYMLLNSFKLQEDTKQKSLPLFTKELSFKAEVLWDYSSLLAGAQLLPEGKALETMLRDAVYTIHTHLEQRNTTAYQALITPSLAKESDVLYRTPEEVQTLVGYSDLSSVVKVHPVPPFHAQTYCNHKLTKALRDTPDEWGNTSVLTYNVPPLKPGGKEGLARQDFIYYLPAGAKTLHIF